jgi:hypothetical protein
LWKNLCTEASHELQESSAAGYQLRKHYQKYLLKMECLKTGANAGELVKFADSQKKKKKEREPTAQTSEGTPTQQHVQASPKQAAVTSNRSADRTPQQQMQQGFIPPNFPRGNPFPRNNI